MYKSIVTTALLLAAFSTQAADIEQATRYTDTQAQKSVVSVKQVLEQPTAANINATTNEVNALGRATRKSYSNAEVNELGGRKRKQRSNAEVNALGAKKAKKSYAM